MGKAGRFACVFTPMALTIASAVLLVLVSLGNTNRNNSTFNKLYFFRANTTDIRTNASEVDIPNNPFLSAYMNFSSSAPANTTIRGFYHVGLWNYCEGDFKNKTSDNHDVSDLVTNCSDHKAYFWFNPVDVWGLNQTAADHLFSKELRDGLKIYRIVAKWMYVAYLVAIISTAVEILVGISALFSRVGSVATTIVSTVSSIFILAFALTVTILYATLTGTFNHALKNYHIHTSLGRDIFVLLWLAVAFSWAAGLFWLFSSCCCSGRSNRIKSYTDGPRYSPRAPPYTYERVESPHMSRSDHKAPTDPAYQPHPSPQPSVPMQNMAPKGNAYEPYRHAET